MERELKERILVLETAMKNVTLAYTLASILMIATATVMPIVYAMNNSSIQSQFKDFKDEIELKVNNRKHQPEVEILDTKGNDISRSDVEASVFKDEDKFKIRFYFFINNKGRGETGPFSIKLYSGDDLKLTGKTLHSRFTSEFMIFPEDHDIKTLHGNCNTSYYLTFSIDGNENPKKGIYPVMLDFYYGDGLVTQKEFKLSIKN